MPDNSAEQNAESEAFRKMAADADNRALGADAPIDIANYLRPSQDQAVPETADKETAPANEEPVEAQTKIEPERAETAPEEPEIEEYGDETPQEKRKRKDAERFDRNWDEFQKEKTEIRDELRKAREELAAIRSTPPQPAHKDERGYTAEDYESYASKAEEDGDIKSARVARKEAQLLRQKTAYAEFAAGWQKVQAEVVRENPDLNNLETPLAKEVTRLLQEPASIFKTRPDGLKFAVDYAKSKLSTGSISALRSENEKLKKELARLNDLSAVGSDRPHRMSGVGTKSFDSMDAKDQLESIRRQARELDEMRTSG